MTHEEALVLWLLANDGALDPDRRRELDAHLGGCASCRSEVDRISDTDAALRAWGAMKTPAPAGASPTSAARRTPPWLPVAIAAALVGAVLGSVGGYTLADRGSRPPAQVAVAPSDNRATFVLLLEEGPAWPPRQPLMRSGYIDWRDSLEARGQYVGGERLTEDEGLYLDTTRTVIPVSRRSARAPNYSGYFLIRAHDYDEAAAIAAGSPHLNYGGVLIRRAY